AVVGERFDDVRPGTLEVDVQGPEGLRMVERDLGNELAGAEVAPPFELEEEPLGADDGAGVQAPAQRTVGGHGELLGGAGGRWRPCWQAPGWEWRPSGRLFA